MFLPLFYGGRHLHLAAGNAMCTVTREKKRRGFPYERHKREPFFPPLFRSEKCENFRNKIGIPEIPEKAIFQEWAKFQIART